MSNSSQQQQLLSFKESGNRLLQTNQIIEAIQCYLQGIESNDTLGECYHNLGRALEISFDYASAAVVLEKAAMLLEKREGYKSRLAMISCMVKQRSQLKEILNVIQKIIEEKNELDSKQEEEEKEEDSNRSISDIQYLLELNIACLMRIGDDYSLLLAIQGLEAEMDRTHNKDPKDNQKIRTQSYSPLCLLLARGYFYLAKSHLQQNQSNHSSEKVHTKTNEEERSKSSNGQTQQQELRDQVRNYINKAQEYVAQCLQYATTENNNNNSTQTVITAKSLLDRIQTMSNLLPITGSKTLNQQINLSLLLKSPIQQSPPSLDSFIHSLHQLSEDSTSTLLFPNNQFNSASSISHSQQLSMLCELSWTVCLEQPGCSMALFRAWQFFENSKIFNDKSRLLCGIAKLMIARCFNSNNLSQQARQIVAQAQQDSSTSSVSLNNLISLLFIGQALCRDSALDHALIVLNKAIELARKDNNNAEQQSSYSSTLWTLISGIYYWIGKTHYLAFNLDASREAYSQAIRYNKVNYSAQQGLNTVKFAKEIAKSNGIGNENATSSQLTIKLTKMTDIFRNHTYNTETLKLLLISNTLSQLSSELTSLISISPMNATIQQIITMKQYYELNVILLAKEFVEGIAERNITKSSIDNTVSSSCGYLSVIPIEQLLLIMNEEFLAGMPTLVLMKQARQHITSLLASEEVDEHTKQMVLLQFSKYIGILHKLDCENLLQDKDSQAVVLKYFRQNTSIQDTILRVLLMEQDEQLNLIKKFEKDNAFSSSCKMQLMFACFQLSKRYLGLYDNRLKRIEHLMSSAEYLIKYLDLQLRDLDVDGEYDGFREEDQDSNSKEDNDGRQQCRAFIADVRQSLAALVECTTNGVEDLTYLLLRELIFCMLEGISPIIESYIQQYSPSFSSHCNHIMDSFMQSCKESIIRAIGRCQVLKIPKESMTENQLFLDCAVCVSLNQPSSNKSMILRYLSQLLWRQTLSVPQNIHLIIKTNNTSNITTLVEPFSMKSIEFKVKQAQKFKAVQFADCQQSFKNSNEITAVDPCHLRFLELMMLSPHPAVQQVYFMFNRGSSSSNSGALFALIEDTQQYITLSEYSRMYQEALRDCQRKDKDQDKQGDIPGTVTSLNLQKHALVIALRIVKSVMDLFEKGVVIQPRDVLQENILLYEDGDGDVQMEGSCLLKYSQVMLMYERENQRDLEGEHKDVQESSSCWIQLLRTLLWFLCSTSQDDQILKFFEEQLGTLLKGQEHKQEEDQQGLSQQLDSLSNPCYILSSFRSIFEGLLFSLSVTASIPTSLGYFLNTLLPYLECSKLLTELSFNSSVGQTHINTLTGQLIRHRYRLVHENAKRIKEIFEGGQLERIISQSQRLTTTQAIVIGEITQNDQLFGFIKSCLDMEKDNDNSVESKLNSERSLSNQLLAVRLKFSLEQQIKLREEKKLAVLEVLKATDGKDRLLVEVAKQSKKASLVAQRLLKATNQKLIETLMRVRRGGEGEQQGLGSKQQYQQYQGQCCLDYDYLQKQSYSQLKKGLVEEELSAISKRELRIYEELIDDMYGKEEIREKNWNIIKEVIVKGDENELEQKGEGSDKYFLQMGNQEQMNKDINNLGLSNQECAGLEDEDIQISLE